MSKRTPTIRSKTSAVAIPPPPAPLVLAPGIFGVMDAPPDIQKMIAAAPEQISKLRVDLVAPQPPPTPVYQPKGTLANWSLDYLFNGYETSEGIGRVPPVVDKMTLYMMATLARQAYVPAGDALPLIAQALPGASFVRYFPALDTSATYDVWQVSQSQRIMVFPGTTTLEQWLSYAQPSVVAKDYLPSNTQIWAGIAAQIERYRAEVLTRWATQFDTSQPFIFVGHSLGGAIAQVMAYLVNKAYFTLHPEADKAPVKASYTFGSPAFYAASRPVNPFLYFSNTARVFNPGDPIPTMTQLYLSTLKGLITPGIFLSGMFPQSLNPTVHVADDDVPTVRPSLGGLSDLFNDTMRAAMAGGIQLTRRLAAAHTITAYCSQLDDACRGRADVPYNVYSGIARANDAFIRANE